LHEVAATGLRISFAHLRSTLRALDVNQDDGVRSMVDHDLDEWVELYRRGFYRRNQRLPGPDSVATVRVVLAALLPRLVLRYSPLEWWQHDTWDPLLDSRIPLRDIEPRGREKVSFSPIAQPWLRDGIKFWLRMRLETRDLTWSTVPTKRSAFTRFSQFLGERGIDSPTLGAATDPEVRRIAIDFLGWLRQITTRTGARLRDPALCNIQAATGGLYAFAYDHRDVLAALGHDDRWLDLQPVHSRLWRDTYLVRLPRMRGRADGKSNYIDDTVFTTLMSNLDLLGMSPNETKTVNVDGASVEIAGFGDPQSMALTVLLALTGRRVSEVCLLAFDPLVPLEGIPATTDDPDAPVAKLRYSESKIGVSDPTVFVGQRVVDVVRAQQQWNRQFLTDQNSGVAPDQDARYLFLTVRGNRLGHRPYYSSALAERLRRLAAVLNLRDSAGHPVDLNRTHRFRHTMATNLIDAGVNIPAVMAVLGHTSPEMAVHYHERRQAVARQEFVRLQKVGAAGRNLDADPALLFDLLQLGNHTDRVLPDGYCMLPPRHHCDRGNACHGCGNFATDRTFLPQLDRQLHETRVLIATRQDQHHQRTGTQMADTNVWLQSRLDESHKLEAIIASLETLARDDHRPVQSPGVRAREDQ
jgi:integrase